MDSFKRTAAGILIFLASLPLSTALVDVTQHWDILAPALGGYWGFLACFVLESFLVPKSKNALTVLSLALSCVICFIACLVIYGDGEGGASTLCISTFLVAIVSYLFGASRTQEVS